MDTLDNKDEYDYVWPFDFAMKQESEEPIRVPPIIVSETKPQFHKTISPFFLLKYQIWHKV